MFNEDVSISTNTIANEKNTLAWVVVVLLILILALTIYFNHF